MNSKAWLQSTTVWGLLLIAVGQVVGYFGLPGELADPIANVGAQAADVIGLIVAAIGRKNADTPLVGILPK